MSMQTDEIIECSVCGVACHETIPKSGRCQRHLPPTDEISEHSGSSVSVPTSRKNKKS